ncbi:hypothetical protein [Natronincola ferrireducens]|uniref:DUF3168 domain-containing protein n=1 Tax=Natronincola ferrireducens TaxID=393762 RepID=A0A1G9I5M4_9FIRM|nr:hypothetical protein [Natronincola ferrireducens]SDL20548.1 hypothetical protein SAMN05660472_02806 [Natronincola ferrireducens]
MDLINHVHSILSPLNIPVLWQLRPKNPPCISYHFFNEQGILYGDGEELTGSISCQVDIWSRNNFTDIKKQVKSAMKSAGFLFSHADENFEEDVKLHHCFLVFNFYYRESEE